VNYGYNTVRFMSPVPVGTRIRLRAILSEVTDAPGGVDAVITGIFEREGAQKPACVAEMITRLYAKA
jgi:acyl dehydratase